MIGLTFLFLVVVSSQTLVFGSESSFDCSVFETEEQIFESLPFLVSIHPAAVSTLDTYALFNEGLRIVELQLYNEDSVPLAIFCLKHLQKLVLKYGNITIPADIGRLNNLAYLEISKKENNPTSVALNLPSELFSLTNLKTLILVNCSLETLPESIGQLVRLEELTLIGNRLNSLPPTMNLLQNLGKLDLSNNLPLTSLDALNGLRDLFIVKAINCSIDHLPLNISYLRTFDLSNNNLMSLAGIETLIARIDANNNPGSTFSFNYNQITSIPTVIANLWVTDLNLKANKLTTLPEEIFNMDYLRSLNVENNMFSDKKLNWYAGLARRRFLGLYF